MKRKEEMGDGGGRWREVGRDGGERWMGEMDGIKIGSLGALLFAGQRRLGT